jgi:hypothetical protein
MVKSVKKNLLTPRQIESLEARYKILALELGGLGGLSQGSVVRQPPNAWCWTRKVRGKTVTRGLSPQKAEKMKQAIANQRAANKLIDEMRAITQKLILESPESTQIFGR